MDAFFAPYLFPNERYFIGAIVFLVVALCVVRWRVANRKKDA